MPKTASFAHWALEPYCIGMKLRALRTRKNLTLSRLAAETGLSTALLSKLETDRMIPTLPTLATISRVYGVGLGYFFSEAPRHSISVTRKAHLQGTTRAQEAVKTIPLNATSECPKLLAEMIDFPEGGASCTSDGRDETTGLFYVLEGQLQLDSGGVQEILEQGDCAYVESEMVMSWSAAGKHRCRVLTVRPAVAAKKGDGSAN